MLKCCLGLTSILLPSRPPRSIKRPSIKIDPLTALGVASNIIQIVDFSTRVISRTHEIYKANGGRVDTHTILDDKTKNLSELCAELKNFTLSSHFDGTTVDAQLIRLIDECEM
ncbi:hypothetical protein CC78DRAFT_40841 [Lojkania enalia]|uniref:Uncharacterized protein n=1 Tax=Lojkania enalia TaxID=147567 RepID=A0A9P4K255_9PLEO|nr:hypothetical protein CC78DRAFT_40841 [Didymosphaeria enalia]